MIIFTHLIKPEKENKIKLFKQQKHRRFQICNSHKNIQILKYHRQYILNFLAIKLSFLNNNNDVYLSCYVIL